MKINLWTLAAPVKYYILAAIITGVFCNFAVIGLMAAAAYLIINAALQVPLYQLSLAITAVRACGILRAVFRYAERYIAHNAAFLIWERLRLAIYKNIMRALPFSQENMHDGDIFMAVIESLDELRDAVLRLLLPPLTAGLMTMALFAFILPYSILAAIILAAGFFIIVIIIPYCFYKHNTSSKSSLQAELWEFIAGARELKLFDYAEKRRQQSYKKINERTIVENHLFTFSLWAETLAQIIAAVVIVSILASFIFVMPQITATQSAVLLLAIIAAMEIIVPLAAIGQQLEIAQMALNRLDKLLQPQNTALPPAQKELINTNEIIAAKNIVFSFKQRRLFKNMNFAIEKNKKTALLGGSGSGKSTLVNILLRLLAYEEGTIFYEQQAYPQITPEQIRNKIRAALQDQYIFAMTIRENFKLLYPAISDKEIYAALEKAELADFIMNSPTQLDLYTGSRGCYLSGGQSKRLSIALALAAKSDMLILDEPTAGLDALTAHEIMETIMNLTDKTVLIITHDLSAIKKFDKIIILQAGEIIEEGTPADLIKRQGQLVDMLNYRSII